MPRLALFFLAWLACATAALAQPALSTFSSDITFVSKNGVTALFNQAEVGDEIVITMRVSNAPGADEATSVSGYIYLELGFDQIVLGSFVISQINPGETVPITIVPNLSLPVPPLALPDVGNGEPGFAWTIAQPTLWLHSFMIEITFSEPLDSTPLDNTAARSLQVGSHSPPGEYCDVVIEEPSASNPWYVEAPGGLVVEISDPAGVLLEPNDIEHMAAFFTRSDDSGAHVAAPLDFLGNPPLHLRTGSFGGSELVTIPASETGQSIAIKPMAILPSGGSCTAELVIQVNAAPVATVPALSALSAGLLVALLSGLGLAGLSGSRRKSHDEGARGALS